MKITIGAKQEVDRLTVGFGHRILVLAFRRAEKAGKEFADTEDVEEAERDLAREVLSDLVERLSRYESQAEDQGRVIADLKSRLGLLGEWVRCGCLEASLCERHGHSLLEKLKNVPASPGPLGCPDCQGRHAHDPDYECPCPCHRERGIAHCYGSHCHVMERGSVACACLCDRCKDAKEKDR